MNIKKKRKTMWFPLNLWVLAKEFSKGEGASSFIREATREKVDREKAKQPKKKEVNN